MNIRTGDKVQFVPVPAYELQPDYIATGIVTRLQNWGGVDYALVARDDGLLPKLVDVRELTRLTDTALVKAVQAQVLDDQTREDAIATSRIAEIVDDYDEAMALAQAGNLGVVEL